MINKSANAVVDRLLIIFNVTSDSNLCRKINLNRQTVGTWRQRDSVPYSLCVEIAAEKQISLDWLLTGIGRMDLVSSPEIDKEKRKNEIVEMFDSFDDKHQEEIYTHFVEMKRLNEMEKALSVLQRTVEEMRKAKK